MNWKLLSLLLVPLTLVACAGSAPTPGDKPRPASAGRTSSEPGRLRASQSLQTLPVAPENCIFFSRGEVRLESEEVQKLLAHVLRLKADSKLVLTLVGHTDDLGSPAYNLAIAQQRVDAVYEALRGQGVARNQLRRYAVGSEKMPADCRSASCREQMRRVELVYGR